MTINFPLPFEASASRCKVPATTAQNFTFYDAGVVLEISCRQRGYRRLSGPSALKCLPGGQWNDTLPSCLPGTSIRVHTYKSPSRTTVQ